MTLIGLFRWIPILHLTILLAFAGMPLVTSVATVSAYSADTTPPVTVPSPWMGTYREAQYVTLTCTDGSGSGCLSSSICLKADCKPFLYEKPFKIADPSTLRFYSVDRVGNTEEIRSYDYTIDPALAYRFELKIPSLRQQWHFKYPTGIATGINGSVYVADTDNNRIQKFDSNGNLIIMWGTRGSGVGQLDHPAGVAVDDAGNLYVADSYNARIQKFDSSGNYLLHWGTSGSGNGEFSVPSGVAVGAFGNVYVADKQNHRIQVFDGSGRYLSQWGSAGNGDGQFSYPSGVAVAADGNIFVADTSNNRIQVFDRKGNYLYQWGSSGFGTGQFSAPESLAVDAAGSVYVADTGNWRIQKFDSKGGYLNKFTVSRPYGVAVDAVGNIYGTTVLHSVEKLDSSGTVMGTWGITGNGNGEFFYPSKVAVDASGNLYVADTSNHRIQKFDSGGSYLSQWSIGGFSGPTDVAVDAVGNVYVTSSPDTTSYVIKKFDSSGTPLSTWYSPPGSGENIGTSGLAVDTHGSAYVADPYNHRIQKFSSDGTYVGQWGGYGSGNGQLRGPSGLAVNGLGHLYVSDTHNHRIQVFDSAGVYMGQWGAEGSGTGQFQSPRGVAVDAAGNVYVMDYGNNRIQKFDSRGSFLTQWGTFGSGNGQFNGPVGIAVASDDSVFMVDRDNHRIQKFALAVDKPGAPTALSAVPGDGRATVSFSPPAADGGSPVVFYTARASSGHTATGTGTSLVVTGLTNGTPYTFTVTASNAAGTGPASAASNSVIPAVPVDAICGTDHGTTRTSTPTSLCDPGNPINLSGTGPWTWICEGSNGGNNASCSAQIQMNTLSTTIAGNGSVNSGEGIACTASPQTGTCSKSYPYGTTVTLVATGSNSLFTAWGEACTSCGSNQSCPVTMDSVKTCSATFADLMLVIISGTNQSFPLLQQACAAATNGAVIKARAVTLTEDVVIDAAGRKVIVKGGYDPTFTTQAGVTTVKGTISIRDGGLVVQRVKIR